jgi:hypothetical protein
MIPADSRFMGVYLDTEAEGTSPSWYVEVATSDDAWAVVATEEVDADGNVIVPPVSGETEGDEAPRHSCGRAGAA